MSASLKICLQSQLIVPIVVGYHTARRRHVSKKLVAQNMLQQGNSPEDADKEVSLFLELLDHLGRIETTTHYLPDQYQFDLKIVP